MLQIIKNPKMSEEITKADKIGLYIRASKTQKEDQAHVPTLSKTQKDEVMLNLIDNNKKTLQGSTMFHGIRPKKNRSRTPHQRPREDQAMPHIIQKPKTQKKRGVFHMIKPWSEKGRAHVLPDRRPHNERPWHGPHILQSK
jgi:hypothetical protein